MSLALPATTYARGSAYVVAWVPGGTDDTPGVVSQFAIGAGGQLSPLSPQTINAGRDGFALLIDHINLDAGEGPGRAARLQRHRRRQGVDAELAAGH